MRARRAAGHHDAGGIDAQCARVLAQVTHRRAAVAQSVAWVTFEVGAFSFVKGEPTRYRTETAAWRTFCPRCGTSLTYEADDRPNDIDITVGSLDQPEDFPPNKAVFAQERLAWDPLLTS